MKTPKKIEPSPLVEAVADVRFNPSIPPAAVFGYVYGRLREDYGSPHPLPILQVPEEIREKDANLTFQPHYRLESKPFVLQMGPRIFNVAALEPEYPGWGDFRKEILRLFTIFCDVGVIGETTRIGMRYINFFERNVFEISRFCVTLGDSPLSDEKTVLRVQFFDDNWVTAIQVTNDGSIQTGGDFKRGSVIDLDTFCSNPDLTENPPEVFPELIENGHELLKRKFFESLKEDFVASLNPEYD